MTTFLRLDPDPDKADYLPYAPAVVVPAGSEYFFLSGATALPLYHAHPHIPEESILPDDMREQTLRVMKTLTDLLAWLGLDWSNVVHTYEFVTDLRDADTIHAAMAEFLGEDAWTPAATIVGVNSLSAPGARLELDIIAARPPSAPVSERPAPGAVALPGHGPIVSVASDEELLWMSGSTAIDFYHHHPHIEDEEEVPYRASGQVEKILGMFAPVLEGLGVGWGDIVKQNVWATDFRDLPAFEAAIAQRFADAGAEPPTVKVDIAGLSGPAARLELEFVVSRGPKPDPGAPATVPAPVIEILQPDPAKAHLLPYAPAIRVADAPLHFLSAVGPLPYEADGELPDDMTKQASMLFDNLDAQLAALGLGWRNVVRATQLLTDIRDVEQFSMVMVERYGTSWWPAGTMAQIDALPVKGARIQLDVIAAG